MNAYSHQLDLSLFSETNDGQRSKNKLRFTSNQFLFFSNSVQMEYGHVASVKDMHAFPGSALAVRCSLRPPLFEVSQMTPI